MNGPETLLQVERLVKHFPADRGIFRKPGAVRALDGVSLSVARGETLALVGESGSGKTTLARCIVRLTDPDAGRVVFDGVDVLALTGTALRSFRRRMQIVFQDPYGSLNPRMRIGTAVREPIEIHRLAPRAEADGQVAALLQEVGLQPDFADRYPHELSGGQRQRVGIARALAPQPDLLVLDEPVSALDVSVQAQVLQLLRLLQERRGLTYLFIAHDLAVVRMVAARVAVMYLGRIVEQAAAGPIYAASRHPYTRSLLSAVPTPTPGTHRERIVLTGDPPSPVHLPSGCVFHPRCPHPRKDERCRVEVPLLREVGESRVACHYAETSEEAGRGGRGTTPAR